MEKIRIGDKHPGSATLLTSFLHKSYTSIFMYWLIPVQEAVFSVRLAFNAQLLVAAVVSDLKFRTQGRFHAKMPSCVEASKNYEKNRGELFIG